MPEYYQLAQEAAAALQAMANPASTTAEIAGVFIGVGQLALIGWGIHVMKGSNKSREATTETLQVQMGALQAQGEVLAGIGAGIHEVLERTSTRTRRSNVA